MSEDTMVVNAYPVTPGWTGSTYPGGVSIPNWRPPVPHVANIGHYSNFNVVSIGTDIFDTTARKDSKIDPVTGEIAYDDIVSIERGDQRVLIVEVKMTAALEELKKLGTVWKKGSMYLILGNGDRLKFKDVGQMIDFINNSNRIANETFIRAKEGFSATGYVPKNAAKQPDVNSGVTIGIGVDLGGKTKDSMLNDGVSKEFVNLLEPYLGLKGKAAQDKLTKSPLTITEAQAMDLSKNYINRFSSGVASKYQAATGSNFSKLPLGTRTAIVSVSYQYGQNLAAATPEFWKQVTSGRWADAVKNLNNFKDNFPTRRQSEAALIQADIAAGKLK